MNKIEKKAAKEWKEYYKAIKKYKLDNIKDRWHNKTIDYMYDAFFAGFYSSKPNYSKENLLNKIMDVFENAPMSGADIDVPEGSRYVILSETLINKFIKEFTSE